jgi:hypothetical protein
MDWLQWSSSIIGSIAWPIALVVAAYLLRKHLAELLVNISELTWGDKKVTFKKGLDNLERQVETAPSRNQEEQPPHAIEHGSPAAPEHIAIGDKAEAEIVPAGDQAAERATQQDQDRLWVRMLELSPAVAVLETWSDIERRIDRFLTHIGAMVDKNQSVIARAKALYDARLLSNEGMKTLVELHRLRNAAAQGVPVSAIDAARFKSLADKMLAFITNGRDAMMLKPDHEL